VENGIPIKTWYNDKSDRELYNLIPVLEYLAYVSDVRDHLKKFCIANEVNYKACYAMMEAGNRSNLINPGISNISTINKNKFIEDSYNQQSNKHNNYLLNNAKSEQRPIIQIETPSNYKKKESENSNSININIINQNISHIFLNEGKNESNLAQDRSVSNPANNSYLNQNSYLVSKNVGKESERESEKKRENKYSNINLFRNSNTTNNPNPPARNDLLYNSNINSNIGNNNPNNSYIKLDNKSKPSIVNNYNPQLNTNYTKDNNISSNLNNRGYSSLINNNVKLENNTPLSNSSKYGSNLIPNNRPASAVTINHNNSNNILSSQSKNREPQNYGSLERKGSASSLIAPRNNNNSSIQSPAANNSIYLNNYSSYNTGISSQPVTNKHQTPTSSRYTNKIEMNRTNNFVNNSTHTARPSTSSVANHPNSLNKEKIQQSTNNKIQNINNLINSINTPKRSSSITPSTANNLNVSVHKSGINTITHKQVGNLSVKDSFDNVLGQNIKSNQNNFSSNNYSSNKGGSYNLSSRTVDRSRGKSSTPNVASNYQGNNFSNLKKSETPMSGGSNIRYNYTSSKF
jgi:hypothetical protein